MIQMKNLRVFVPRRADALLGYTGEHRSRRLSIRVDDPGDWAYKLELEYEDGQKNILDLIAGDGVLYTDIERAHVSCGGVVRAQVRGVRGEEVVKSNVFILFVRDAVQATEAFDPLEPAEFEQLERRLTALKGEAETAASTARDAAGRAEDTAGKLAEENRGTYEEVAGLRTRVEDCAGGVESVQRTLIGKVDGAFVEGGYLYLTADDEIVAGPLGPFSGGGGAANNAVISLSNTTGWLARTIAAGAPCPLSLTWSSTEDGLPTGDGVLRIAVNGAVRLTRDVEQGAVAVDVTGWLGAGTNAVKATVSDVYGNSRTVNFSVTVVAVSIASPFDAGTPCTGAITYPYIPTGSVDKTVHFVLDGAELGTVETAVSGRQLTYPIPAQAHGAHTLEVYFTAEAGGQTIESNHLYEELICVEAGETAPIVASAFRETAAAQYAALSIPYRVYDPAGLTAAVTLSANGVPVAALTVGRTEQVWSYRPDAPGALTLEIACGAARRTFSLTVAASAVDVEAAADGLALCLSSEGRSNSEADPGRWESGGVAARFTGFNFASDGWQLDGENGTVLRVAGDARLEIPLPLFAQDCRTTGKTVEIEFAARDVQDADAVVLSCFSGGRGLRLTARQAALCSEQTALTAQYKEGEHVRVSFVVEKRGGSRLLCCYLDGVLSGAAQYPEDDDFAQTEPVGISVGSNDCAVDLYTIRVYDSDLTRHQILDNWIADTRSAAERAARWQRNNIFDAYGGIVRGRLPADLPYLVLEADALPQYKGDKKTVSGRYVDPADSRRSFTFAGARIDVQGTSSQYYARKNYKIAFAGGFAGESGETAETYRLRDGSIPTDTFTFKADVASSEGANNVELVRLYNDVCPVQTPPQAENPAVRQGIDGLPIVVFWQNGEEVVFLGKYNFNNDKGTPAVYGLGTGDESWEILNNTGARALWKSADFSGEDWKNDFEARHPEGNADVTNLRALAAWLASTDQSAATGAALDTPAVYEGVRYDADTAAYRLAKFRAELPDYMELDAVLFNYLFTELFLLVDNRAKNVFPTRYAGGKWLILPYDYDTAMGTNNEGALAFGYALEDIDRVDGADVFNGQASVLWVNLRQAFAEELRALYQRLRSTGALSYSDTERRFAAHQAKWPEAVFNEDGYYKYLAPLLEDNNASYLPMLQGSKAGQRRWWLYNRFRYLDSKYNAGDALTDVITLRGYAKADLAVTPYADLYATAKFGSYLVQARAPRGQSCALACPLDAVNDTEIYLYSASQLAEVGDLSGLRVGYADFASAVRLRALKLGDGGADYENPNLTALHLGNNTLLRTLDVRNCPKLAQTVDVSGCTGLEHVWFDGTAVTGLTLPNGGSLKTLHLPGTVTNLTLRSQPALADFALPSGANLTTLRLEHVGAAVDARALLREMPAGGRVRLIGFDWTFESAEELLALYDLLDTMRGLDESGGNLDGAQLDGTAHIPTLTSAQLAECRARYPGVTVDCPHVVTYTVSFYNGDALLQKTENVSYGDRVVYTGDAPVRSGVADPEHYAFLGWSPSPDFIRGDTVCRAQYRHTLLTETIADDWETIFAAEADGSYRTRYQIGDTKQLDLGALGIVCMQIAAFDADPLPNGGTAPISWISEQALPGDRRINPARAAGEAGGYQSGTGAIGGWPACELRAYLRETVKPLLPDEVRAHLRTVRKHSNGYTTAAALELMASEDDLWIPSTRDLAFSDKKEAEGPMYSERFPDLASHLKKRTGEDAAVTYWLRSAGSGAYWCFVRADTGDWSTSAATTERAVVLGFCT